MFNHTKIEKYQEIISLLMDALGEASDAIEFLVEELHEKAPEFNYKKSAAGQHTQMIGKLASKAQAMVRELV